MRTLMTWFVLCALLVLAAGCTTSGDAGRGVAAGQNCDAGFVEVAAEWNRHTGAVVGAYLDPAVSPFDYVEVSAARMPELSSQLAKMRDLLSTCDPALSGFYGDLVENYRDKRDALVQLEEAVGDLSVSGEQEALRSIDKANADAAELACSVAELGGITALGVGASGCG